MQPPNSLGFSVTGSNISVPNETSPSPILWCPLEKNSKDFLKKETAIAAVYIVTSLLSIFGAGSVIIYAFIKKIVRNPEVCPLFHLAVADLFLAAFWLTGASLWFTKKVHHCFTLDVVAEMVHLASFFLTVNYGFTAYIRLKEKTHNICNLHFLNVNVSHREYGSLILKASYVVCWFIPVAVMLPLFIYGSIDGSFSKPTPRCTRCLLLFDRPKADAYKANTNDVWLAYGSVALTATLSFSIVTLLLLYFLTLRVYRKAVIYSGVMTDRQRSSIDAIRNRIFLYILVFLFCWSPALVVATVDLDPEIKRITQLGTLWFVLFLFQGLTAPMQGFLNCIVYGWTRKSFREASGRQRLFMESDEFDSVEPRRNSYGSIACL